MKGIHNSNLLQTTVELLSSNDSVSIKPNLCQTHYCYNSLKSNKQGPILIENQKQTISTKSNPYSEEFDQYKEMIKKMNSDIGDINNKLLSIDNSINTSIVTDNYDTKRSTEIHVPNIKTMKPVPIQSNRPNSVFSFKGNMSSSESTKDINKPNDAYNPISDRDEKLLQLEANRQALLVKNQELESQLHNLDCLLQGDKTTTQTSISETNTKQQNTTESNLQKFTALATDDLGINHNTRVNRNSNSNNQTTDYKSSNTTYIDNNKAVKDQIAKYTHIDLDDMSNDDEKESNTIAEYTNKGKRSCSSRQMKLKKKITSNEDLLKENEILKAKLNDLKKMISNGNSSYFIPTNNKENYYLEIQEKRYFIDRIHALEVSFNNQLRALNQKYQSTIDTQQAKIAKLTKENSELKRKVKQVKELMK